jgi:ribosome-binding protein aMBF1 (putative translation factor)
MKNSVPYDQPLAIVKDPEFMLQNHIENVIAQIKEELARKKVSKKYLARQLETSDNQIQRLLNPNILNKNLTQLYKLASLLELQFEINLTAA